MPPKDPPLSLPLPIKPIKHKLTLKQPKLTLKPHKFKLTLKPPKIKDKYITFKGQTKYYNDATDLASTLKINTTEAQKLIDNPDMEKVVLNKNTGQITKYKVKDKPLVLTTFGIKKQGITNKIYITDEHLNKKQNIFIGDHLSDDQIVEVVVTITMYFQYSEDEFVRVRTYIIKSPVKDLEDKIFEHANGYRLEIDDNALLKSYTYEIHNDTKKTHKLDLADAILKDLQPLNINNLYKELIDQCIINNEIINIIPTKENCVINSLKYTYPKISKKKIEALGNNKDGITSNEICNFLSKYGIKVIAYDINGNVIASNMPAKPNSSYRSFIFIAYNSHIYQIKNKTLKKKHKKKYDKCEIVDEGYSSMMTHIKEGILPSDINLNDFGKTTFDANAQPIKSNPSILSYVVNDIKYIENVEYQQCLDILKLWGCQDLIYDRIGLSSIGKIIAKLYLKDLDKKDVNIRTHWPNHQSYIKGGYNYIDKEQKYDADAYITHDKNKCYPYCLSKLEYLIYFDYRQAEIIDKPTEIIPHYLYIVKPKYSSLLLPKTAVYYGQFILNCQTTNIEFEILEGISTKKEHNYLKNMVIDIFYKLKKAYGDKGEKMAKEILNRYIGSMECNKSFGSKYIKLDKFCNEQEIETTHNPKIDLNNGYWLSVSEKRTKPDLYSHKPISIQIKDMSRWLTYQHMIELKISGDDILQTKTDAVTFKKKYSDKFYNKNLDSASLDGWKAIPYKSITNEIEPIDVENMTFYQPCEPNQNKLMDCFAGCGKTHEIIHQLIPSIGNDYIVLTPSHCTLLEYRKLGLKCDVIQKYSLSTTVPDEKHIIIDEIGLTNRIANDVITICHLQNKTITAYGDFEQMLPVKQKRHYNSKQYLQHIFSQFGEMNTNHRNHFTREYYRSIYTAQLDYLAEVKKWGKSSFEQADIIICHTRATRDIYNNLMLKHLSFKDMFQVGVKLICHKNKLRKTGIYNGFVETIMSIDNGMYKLSNGFIYTHEEIDKNFRPAYARTIYSYQGQSVTSYYFTPEDDKYITPRMAYTIISRLKTK